MKMYSFKTLVGSSLLLVTCVASAQTVTASGELEEIIVTARRRAESLEDVPQTVNAVTSDTIDKLNLLSFQDLQSVVPGVTLATDNTGYGVGASMRGVTYNVVTNANPTVAFYMNDVLAGGNVFQSMYDIGQIEVLRGPQGTVRGAAAPSGAITVTTHKPDLYKFGGYAAATATNQNTYNLQGAFNAPLVSEKLAVRVAGVINDDEYNAIRSVNNPADPHSYTKSIRTTVAFQPTDSLSINLMYENLTQDQRSFDQITGPGSGNAARPAIASSDRTGVSDGAHNTRQAWETWTAQADWRFAGQKLSYVGGYTWLEIRARAPQDIGNVVPNFETYQVLDTRSNQHTHELRLASEEQLLGFLDYTVGIYSFLGKATYDVDNGPTFLFPVANPALAIQAFIKGDSPLNELSGFASLTFHLGPKTEITGGARHIESWAKSLTRITAVIPAAIIPPSGATSVTPIANSYDLKTWIYNGAISHRFTDDLMVYANVGTSFRPGPAQISVTNGANDPVLRALQFPEPEKSRSYEIGLKTAAFDKRLRMNVAAYYQKFTNSFYYTPQKVAYFSNNGQTGSLSSANFTANADAKVQGIDMDATFLVLPRWTVGLAASYSDGKLSNARIPCNDPSFPLADTAGQRVALCNSNVSMSTTPYWNATLQSEYSIPIISSMDGFIRGLYTYYPENKHASPSFVADSYGLLNLYLGVRHPENTWDVTLFAKNLTNTGKTLSVDAAQNISFGGVFGPTNYFATSYTPRRELGLTLHYAFGSR